MDLKRRKFQGMLNILSFNRHFYVAGFIDLCILCGSYFIFDWPPILFFVVLAAFLYGLLMPLLVSAYVYDYSGYYDFQWLKQFGLKDSPSQQILNINAGFDETSFILHDIFPESELKVYDFYDAKRHTERAIVRARKVSLVYPGTQQISTASIPLADNSTDLIFLLSAAHEIRKFEEKVQFLKECHRVCKPGARVMMVEHLRDLPNFLAYTIGFFHFFSKRTWQKAYAAAGFSPLTETKFTPFMSIFHYRA